MSCQLHSGRPKSAYRSVSTTCSTALRHIECSVSTSASSASTSSISNSYDTASSQYTRSPPDGSRAGVPNTRPWFSTIDCQFGRRSVLTRFTSRCSAAAAAAELAAQTTALNRGTRRGLDRGALGRDRGPTYRPRSDRSRAAVVIAVLVSATVEEEPAAATAAAGTGAVVVGDDDRAAVGVLLDTLCICCPG